MSGGTRFGVEKGREVHREAMKRSMDENGAPPSVAGEGCGDRSGSRWGLEGYPLAMAYAPLQNFTELYDPEKGLARGTIFSQLDLPLMSAGHAGRGGMMRNG